MLTSFNSAFTPPKGTVSQGIISLHANQYLPRPSLSQQKCYAQTVVALVAQECLVITEATKVDLSTKDISLKLPTSKKGLLDRIFSITMFLYIEIPDDQDFLTSLKSSMEEDYTLEQRVSLLGEILKNSNEKDRWGILYLRSYYKIKLGRFNDALIDIRESLNKRGCSESLYLKANLLAFGVEPGKVAEAYFILYRLAKDESNADVSKKAKSDLLQIFKILVEKKFINSQELTLEELCILSFYSKGYFPQLIEKLNSSDEKLSLMPCTFIDSLISKLISIDDFDIDDPYFTNDPQKSYALAFLYKHFLASIEHDQKNDDLSSTDQATKEIIDKCEEHCLALLKVCARRGDAKYQRELGLHYMRLEKSRGHYYSSFYANQALVYLKAAAKLYDVPALLELVSHYKTTSSQAIEYLLQIFQYGNEQQFQLANNFITSLNFQLLVDINVKFATEVINGIKRFLIITKSDSQ